jgi:hypothetical protein
MCKAFSGLITKSGKVYWKMGVDSHEEQREIFVKEDPELRDDKMPPTNTFARFEILPKNGNYFSPDKWVFELDERIEPSWWEKSLEKPCFEAHRQWLEQLYSMVKLDEVRHPINPFTNISERKRVTKKDLAMLKEWSLVRNYVISSVWDSVQESVGYSVLKSVWESVENGKFSCSYLGSLFNVSDWKYIDWRKKPFNKIGKGNYPFRSGEYLWRHGFMPSLDGTTWYW